MLLAVLDANALETLYYAGGVIGAAITAAAGTRRIRPTLRRRVHRMDRLDQLLGDPTASPPLPGVLEHVAALRDEVADVRGVTAELVPNSGSSWRDAYERDQAHQHLVNLAIARALGIELPPQPPRHRSHDDE
ncbi:hypothetical protein [Streptomyces sp. IBSBF 2950]|uniref:hypothetical protein n=1 Tax=Streptomyces sp. IBSBF 2950 TaxID=2903528 RepID=UPI002FDC6693